jgi:hypothetical protein
MGGGRGESKGHKWWESHIILNLSFKHVGLFFYVQKQPFIATKSKYFDLYFIKYKTQVTCSD